MALPTLVKTWSYDVNNAVLGGDSVWPTHHLQWKNKLVGFGHGWVVAGSGGDNGGSPGGGMDSVDRWGIAGDITIGSTSTTSGNSWMVLQNDNIQTGFQVLYTPYKGGGGWTERISYRVSPGGLYTGGGVTTTPTATDEITISEEAVIGISNNSPACRTHMAMSSDGQSTRIWLTESGVVRAFHLFDRPVNTVSGWTNPWVAMGVNYASASVLPQYNDLYEVDTYTFGLQGSTTMKFFCTAEGFDSVTTAAAGQRLTVVNSLDSNGFHIGAIGLATQTLGLEGRHGEVADLFWTATILGEGDHFPSGLPREMVILGNIMHPWDGTAGQMLF